jgi:Pyrimidine dimer DNA glycosylase/Protein of unknown function (DUF1722)
MQGRVRIWDVSPGYLNRQSLLGEHRELHGLYSILVNGRTGYARHPETRRWVGCLTGLARRHALLAAEMRLRGYRDGTPIAAAGRTRWPAAFIDPPGAQYALLAGKYRRRESGRIPLPRGAHDLWAQHKYSVMARDPEAYRVMGRRVGRMRRGADFAPLAEELAVLLRDTPPRARLANALEHMWGYVSSAATPEDRGAAAAAPAAMLRVTSELALRDRQPYLLASTALSDLAIYVDRAARTTR